MKFLFQAIVVLGDKFIYYTIYLYTNGSYCAESMNPDYDNFMLKKVNGQWTTGLIRNQESAEQIGKTIEQQES